MSKIKISGYETRLIIGTLDNAIEVENPKFVSVIAEIDLCNTDVFFDTYLDKERDTERVFIYASDDETHITQDKYGSPLLAVPPKEVLKLMVAANKEHPYRRYQAAIPMLESLIETFKYENLTCILFGH